MIGEIASAFRVLGQLAKEGAISEVQRERIELLGDQLQAVAKQVEELQAANARQKRKLARQNRKLAEYAALEQFTEERGVLFKKKPAGGYHADPFCPQCRLAMRYNAQMVFICSTCTYIAPIGPGAMKNVTARLPPSPSPAASVDPLQSS